MLNILLYVFSKDFWVHSGILFLIVIIVKIFSEYYQELPSGSNDNRKDELSNKSKDFNIVLYLKELLIFSVKVFAIIIGIGVIIGILDLKVESVKSTLVHISFTKAYVRMANTWIFVGGIALGTYFGVRKLKNVPNFNVKTVPRIIPVKEKNEVIRLERNLKEGCPPLSLLNPMGTSKNIHQENEMKSKLERCFKEYDLDFLKILKVETGPTITRFTISMSTTGRISSVMKLEREMSMFLRVQSITITPSANGLVIEVPNSVRSDVSYTDTINLFMNNKCRNPLEIPVGKTAVGDLLTIQLNKMPHLLIAGATGSGKSVCINGIIASILLNATPEEIRLIFIDPKVVEFSGYNGIPHLLTPVITDPDEATKVLDWAVQEMETRYETFAKAGVRNLESYNAKLKTNEKKMPSIVIVIDELADLVIVARKSKKEEGETAGSVEESIQRLGQKARAAGIHLVVGTQRPSADVVTGTIKTNIPGRIAFAVADGTNSRIIIDENGAEKLLGRGDGLLLTTETRTPVRFQSAYISDQEVENIVEWWRGRNECEEDYDKFKPILKENKDSSQSHLSEIPHTTLNEHEFYIAVKKYVAEVALEEDEEIYLPAAREIAELLKFGRTSILENLNTLVEEGWLSKVGTTPRNIRYKVSIGQDEACIYLKGTKK